jgi:hypothetical protein
MGISAEKIGFCGKNLSPCRRDLRFPPLHIRGEGFTLHFLSRRRRDVEGRPQGRKKGIYPEGDQRGEVYKTNCIRSTGFLTYDIQDENGKSDQADQKITG